MRSWWARASRYVREDLREIISPSSIPDPPGTPPAPPSRSLREWAEVRFMQPLCTVWLCSAWFYAITEHAYVLNSHRSSVAQHATI